MRGLIISVPKFDFNKSYARWLNQAVKTTSSPTFAGLTVNGDIEMGANSLHSSNLALKEWDSGAWVFLNYAEDGFRGLRMGFCAMIGSLFFEDDALYIAGYNADGGYLSFKGRDNGVGLVEVARIQGQAEPRFKFILPAQLYVKTDTGDPTGNEGDIYVNTFDNAVRVYADGSWRDLLTW